MPLFRQYVQNIKTFEYSAPDINVREPLLSVFDQRSKCKTLIPKLREVLRMGILSTSKAMGSARNALCRRNSMSRNASAVIPFCVTLWSSIAANLGNLGDKGRADFGSFHFELRFQFSHARSHTIVCRFKRRALIGIVYPVAVSKLGTPKMAFVIVLLPAILKGPVFWSG